MLSVPQDIGISLGIVLPCIVIIVIVSSALCLARSRKIITRTVPSSSVTTAAHASQPLEYNLDTQPTSASWVQPVPLAFIPAGPPSYAEVQADRDKYKVVSLYPGIHPMEGCQS